MYQLKSCVWELTRACSLRCLHCGSQAGACREEELSESEAMGIAKQLVGLGCKTVTLIGGEVTLCPYWPQLAHSFLENGAVCRIVTNGYRKTDQDYAAIRESGIDSAALSVDGMEALHNRIRGREDAFAEAERFCKTLLEMKVPLTAVTTITRDCVDQLEDLYLWLMGNGVRAWQCPRWGMPGSGMIWCSGRRMCAAYSMSMRSSPPSAAGRPSSWRTIWATM